MKITLLAFALASSSILAANWPHFLGPNHNGTSNETGLLKSFPASGPEITWESTLEGGFGGAAVVGDEIFIVDRVHQEKDVLRCLDFANGKEKWNFENPSQGEPSYPGSRSVPTVEKDAVYFISPFGQVFRINRKTHKADWQLNLTEKYKGARPPRWGYAQCTLVVGDILILTPFGAEAGIIGVNKKTGKEVWQSGPIGDSHSSPTLMNFGGQPQVIILTTGEGGGLHSYDPKSGKVLWESDLYHNQIPITVPIQVDEERLFVSGGYNAGSKMLSIKKRLGGFRVKELWSTKKGSQVHPPILVDKHLYLLANENSNHRTKSRRSKGGLTCFTLDGKELWNTGFEPFMGRGSMIHADGALFIQDGEKGTLRIVDPSPKGFKLLAEANVFDSNLENRKDLHYWSNLALSQGTLLMRGQNRLLCVKLKK